uniref:Uncharacterized protein n=1 Tax=Cacopsylla melanoneura TaxID=428564 RepID=A0A8D8V5K0_9HEMI
MGRRGGSVAISRNFYLCAPLSPKTSVNIGIFRHTDYKTNFEDDYTSTHVILEYSVAILSLFIKISIRSIVSLWRKSDNIFIFSYERTNYITFVVQISELCLTKYRNTVNRKTLLFFT